MATTASISELMGLMQQNLDAINYHLERISNTKAHDDEIERLENERQKRADILGLQLVREAQELEMKRRQLGQPAAEKHRQEREKVAAKRAQEQRELAAARRKEDQEILARRMREDAVRKARLEQEDEEMKAMAQKEEEQILASLADEEEKRRKEAAERENSLFEEFEVRMTQLEDEMEKKIVESTKILAELDEKRKAISAQIDAQMKPKAIRPTFRRGSKRYSITGMAADVAAMLGKPSLERRSTLSQIIEKEAPVRTESPRPTTPSRSDTSSSRRSIAGSIRSLKSEDADDVRAREEMARINAEIMAEMEQDRSRTPKQVETARIPLHRMSLSRTESLRSVKSEDPEDVRAKEEMARINAEIMAAAAAEERTRATADVKTTPRESDEDVKAREEVAKLNAEIMEKNHLSQQKPQARASHPVVPHQRLPTWVNQAKLALVQGSHGVLKFVKEGADMEVIETPRAVGPTPVREASRSVAPFVYNGPKHALLPTWADQSKLDLISGSWGMLSFRQGGADLAIVKVIPDSSSHEPITLVAAGIVPEAVWFGKRDSLNAPYQRTKSRSLIPGFKAVMPKSPRTREEDLPEKLAAVSNGLGSATMNHGKEKPKPIERTVSRALVVEAVGEDYNVNHPALIELAQHNHRKGHPYWSADQAKLRIVGGSHGSLVFNQRGAELKITAPPSRNPYWSANQSRLSIVWGTHGSLMFGSDGAVIEGVLPVDPYWVDQRTLAVVTGEHGYLVFGEYETVMKVKKIDPYWTLDQRTLPVVQGSHGKLAFGANGAAMKIVRPDPYWVDQSTLSVVKGSHGRLAFTPSGSYLEVVRPDPYWVDQSTLSLVKGSYGRLAFGADGAFTKIIRPDPYWVDQSALSLVKGSYGSLAFGPDGASLKVVRPGPYWSADQTSLKSLKGTHAILRFGASEAKMEVPVSNRAYWAVNQAELSIVRGSHGVLDFSTSEVSLKLSMLNSSYWVANQATLTLVRGSHGMLAFNESGAKLEIAGNTRSYWAADQANLELIRGSHGKLVFGSSGATVQVSRTKPIYWSADQNSLETVRGSHGSLRFVGEGAILHAIQHIRPYWTANQASLEELQGSHGQLHFTTEGTKFKAVQQSSMHLTSTPRSREIPVSKEVEPSVKVLPVSTPYWAANQAKLDVLSGSHGMFQFTPEGATTTAQSIPKTITTVHHDPLPTQKPLTYWVDQSRLSQIQGKHGKLIFNDSTSASVPHNSPDPLSNLETGDFFPDSESEEELPISHRRSPNGRTPIMTNLVGNSSYSSFSPEDEDQESPITPTHSMLTLSNPDQINEPMIRTSPESSHREHEHELENNLRFHEENEHREVKLSPLPTQIEFDPVFHQSIVRRDRTPISTKPFELGGGFGGNNPFRRSLVAGRPGAGEGVSGIAKTSALFEGGNQI